MDVVELHVELALVPLRITEHVRDDRHDAATALDFREPDLAQSRKASSEESLDLLGQGVEPRLVVVGI